MILAGSASVGYARTKKYVRSIVSLVVEAKGIGAYPVSRGWWEGFNSRHPHLTLRTAEEKLSYARYVASDCAIINLIC